MMASTLPSQTNLNEVTVENIPSYHGHVFCVLRGGSSLGADSDT